MCPPFVEATAQQTDHKEMDDTPIVPREYDGQLDTNFSFYTSGNQEKHPCRRTHYHEHRHFSFFNPKVQKYIVPGACLFHGIICSAEASCQETYPLGENSGSRTAEAISFTVITVLA